MTIELFNRIAELEAENVQLRLRLKQAYTDDVFGIKTRCYLQEVWESLINRAEKQCCIFMDINDMKIANEKYGYGDVNERLKYVFSHIRYDEVIEVGRYFSGDEIIIICPEDALHHVLQRMSAAFLHVDMSATVVYVEIDKTAIFEETINKLSSICLQYKKLVKTH